MPVGRRGHAEGSPAAGLSTSASGRRSPTPTTLSLRPGEETVRALGGLHRFWTHPGIVLTDSGGFQGSASPSGARDRDADGVTFRSHPRRHRDPLQLPNARWRSSTPSTPTSPWCSTSARPPAPAPPRCASRSTAASRGRAARSTSTAASRPTAPASPSCKAGATPRCAPRWRATSRRSNSTASRSAASRSARTRRRSAPRSRRSRRSCRKSGRAT